MICARGTDICEVLSRTNEISAPAFGNASQINHSLRWHYPNQVIGSKGTPSSQPVCKRPDMKLKRTVAAASSEQLNNMKPFCARRAGFHIISAAKKEYHLMVILRMKHNLRIFLRRHYPHQVKGSKAVPSSQPVKTSSPVENSIASQTVDVNGLVRMLFCVIQPSSSQPGCLRRSAPSQCPYWPYPGR